MVTLKIKFAGGLLVALFVLSMLPTATYGYDDYERYWVDSQNPEVQRMIREVCVFPLENNLMLNLRILFYALGRNFRYDYTREHAWQLIPEMFRQKKGVCDDFARLYYSLLRGIGWPEHCIQMVVAPAYDLFGNPVLDERGRRVSHAWVEIKAPSPSGTVLALSANESIVTLEGEQLVMGFNDTMVTLPEITEERIREVQTLGFFTRNGWIPIDPTVSVCTYGLLPFFADLFLVFGYGMFNGITDCRVHFNEIYPYYANADRKNPSWHNLTVTLDPQESFNVSYLHDIEYMKVRTHISSAVNSTLPTDFEIRNPKMQVIDAVSNVTTYTFEVDFDEQLSPPFPKDLGIYWFTVYNPQTEPVNVTFDAFSRGTMVWLGGEETINQTLYDEYNKLQPLPALPSISVCDEIGDDKNTFASVEDVYVMGGGYPANTEVAIYVIPDGYDLTPNNAKKVTYKTTETNGTLTLTLVWAAPLDLGSYDIWVDVNRNDVFDYGDACNHGAIDIFAFHVIPEIATMFSLLVMFGALATVYLARKRVRR